MKKTKKEQKIYDTAQQMLTEKNSVLGKVTTELEKLIDENRELKEFIIILYENQERLMSSLIYETDVLRLYRMKVLEETVRKLNDMRNAKT